MPFVTDVKFTVHGVESLHVGESLVRQLLVLIECSDTKLGSRLLSRNAVGIKPNWILAGPNHPGVGIPDLQRTVS